MYHVTVYLKCSALIEMFTPTDVIVLLRDEPPVDRCCFNVQLQYLQRFWLIQHRGGGSQQLQSLADRSSGSPPAVTQYTLHANRDSWIDFRYRSNIRGFPRRPLRGEYFLSTRTAQFILESRRQNRAYVVHACQWCVVMELLPLIASEYGTTLNA